MIAAARRSIYIENQYFTAPRIAAALEKRLAEPDGPEIVLVLRLLSHGWLEEATMHVLRTKLIQRLQQADRHGRFRVYYPHIPDLAEGCCLDIHSKLMIVDDAIVRIGSSNLASRSMAFDSECDLVIEARGEARVADDDPRVPRAAARRAPRHAARARARGDRARRQPARRHRRVQRPAAHPAPARGACREWSETGAQRGRGRRSRGADRARDAALGAPRRRDARRPERPAWGKLAAVVAALVAPDGAVAAHAAARSRQRGSGLRMGEGVRRAMVGAVGC